MRLDTLPHAIKYHLAKAVAVAKETLVEDGGQDLTFYVCNAVAYVLRTRLYYHSDHFGTWAKQWMDENLITPELLKALDGYDAKECIDDAEIHAGILAYHPALHVTGRDSVPHTWAYEARIKMLNAALAELGYEED